MKRMIDLDQVQADFKKRNNGSTSYRKKYESLRDALHNATIFDNIPRPEGEWIEMRDADDIPYRKCSACDHYDNKTTSVKGHYCWYCGTRMKGIRKVGKSLESA